MKLYELSGMHRKMRTCSDCGAEKSVSDFYPHKYKTRYQCKECHLAYNVLQRKEIRRKVMAHYSHNTIRCSCCGEQTIEFLAIDHVYDNGNIERRKYKSDLTEWRYLIRSGFPDGYQVLCHNCNFAKSLSSGCPHQYTERIT